MDFANFAAIIFKHQIPMGNIKHPEYPVILEMENPWVGEELCKPENALGLKPELVKRILALPAESLRKDLEHLIMYHIGLTCNEIPDDYDSGEQFNGVIGSSLILLAEVGNGESSRDVVLEVLRQSADFSEYHICDIGEDLFVPTICKLGQEHLDVLGILGVQKIFHERQIFVQHVRGDYHPFHIRILYRMKSR